MKIGFFFAKQKLNVFVSRLALNLPKEPDGRRVTREQQSAFLLQAYATALASGYERVIWNAMVDGDTEGEIWGLVRNDGTPRAALQSYQVATTWLAGAQSATWAPLERSRTRWGPDYGTAQVGRVVLNRPWSSSVSQWVSVVWNDDGDARRVVVPKVGNRAKVIDNFSLGFDNGSLGDTKIYVVGVGHTWTLASNLVLDGNIGMNRQDQSVTGPDFGQNLGQDKLGIPGTNGNATRQSGLPDFAVFAWDARGHGRSPGERGFSPSFGTSVRDVQSFVDHIATAWERIARRWWSEPRPTRRSSSPTPINV